MWIQYGWCPWQVLYDTDSQEPKTVHLKIVTFLQIWSLVVYNPVDDGGVVRKLHKSALFMWDVAVLDVQGKHEGAENTALGCSAVQQ